MKDTPILFSAPMVRSIFKDRKTQTRRLRNLATINADPGAWFFCAFNAYGNAVFTKDEVTYLEVSNPYGASRDRLWVRETFYVDYCPYDDGRKLPAEQGEITSESIYYRADGECCQQIPECQCGDVGKPKWRPSIFMRRWASRINLEITGIRVERLQDISGADVVAEGIDTSGFVSPRGAEREGFELKAAIAYAELWNKINGKKHQWFENPWVWVIEFKRI